MRIVIKEKRSTLTNIVVLMLLLAFYYLSFRYPLKMNFSSTSSTYSDTPFVLQVLKYVIYILIVAWFILKKMGSDISVKRKVLVDFGVHLYLFLIPIVYFLMTRDSYLLQTGVFFSLLLFLFMYKELDVLKVSQYFKWFVFISIFAEAVQIFLFVTTGRLPALAYANTISIRFGSLWDDPNGFSFVISFLLPFIITSNMKWKYVIGIVLGIMLVLTQSLTGMFSLAFSIPLGLVILVIVGRKNRHWSILWLLTIGYITGAAVVFSYVLKHPIVTRFIELKSGSIDGHLEFIDIFKNAAIIDFLGLNPSGFVTETGYLNIALNFGLIYLVVYLVVLLVTIFKLAEIIVLCRKKPGIEVYYGAFFFVISYSIGMLNLPLDTVFPLNLLLPICIMFSYIWLTNEVKIRE